MQSLLIFSGNASVGYKSPIIEYELNDIRFEFVAPYFNNYVLVLYQFFLEGYDRSWSLEKSETIKGYTNLREGNHNFMLRTKNKYTEVIMLTVSEDNDDVFDSLCAGACGFLKTHTPPLKLLKAIKEAVNGGAPMSMEIARLVVGSFKTEGPSSDLTSREREVLKKLCSGFSYKKIADELFVDLNTIKFHIRNIYHKLEVHSKGAAIAKAMKENLT